MHQQYQFDRDEIARAAEDAAASLAETRPDENPEGFAAHVIAERLRKAPNDYLQYGPYWWSVKQALQGEAHVFGNTDNETLRGAYGGGLTGHQVLVAGEQFREYYRAQRMAGSATYALGGEDDADAGEYTLFDIDMEILRHGRIRDGLADLGEGYGQAIREPDEPILDDVQVRFEEGGELWTAVVDGGLAVTGADPKKLVAELRRSGRIGRAIDLSKGIAAVVSDGAGPVLTADLQRHQVRIDRYLPRE